MVAQYPTVSVLMTAYKGNDYLLPAINSILDQTYKDLELVIVLDPHEEDICKERIEKLDDPRIYLIKNAKREGLVRSRNIGLRSLRGRYIAIMDSDDISELERIEKEVDFLEKHPDHALAGSPCDIIDESGDVIKKGEEGLNVEQLYYNFLFANQFPHSSVMFRSEVVKKAGSYDERLIVGEDYDLYLRIMENGRAYMFPEVLVRWRRHENSATSGSRDIKESDVFRIIKENIRRSLGVDISDGDLRLYVDHSVRGYSLGSIVSSLNTLERINIKFIENAPEWMDRALLKKISKKKFNSLLTGQIVSNKNLTSIGLLAKNIRCWPSLMAHLIRGRYD